MIGTNADHPTSIKAVSSSLLERGRRNKKEMRNVHGERAAPQCSFSSCSENAAIESVSSDRCLEVNGDATCIHIATTTTSFNTSFCGSSRMDGGDGEGREDVLRGGEGAAVSSPLSDARQWENVWIQYFASHAPDFEKFLAQENWVRKCLEDLPRGAVKRNTTECKSSRPLSSLPLSSLFKGGEVLVPVMGDKESGKTLFIQKLSGKSWNPSHFPDTERVASTASTGVQKVCISVPDRLKKESQMCFLVCAGHEVYQVVHSRILPEAELFVVVWNVATSGLTADVAYDDEIQEEQGGARGGVQKCVASIVARYPEARFVLVGTGIDKIKLERNVKNALTRMRDQVQKIIEKLLSSSTSPPPSSVLPLIEEESRKLDDSEKARSGRGEEGKRSFNAINGERHSRSSSESSDLSFSPIPFVVGNFGVSSTEDKYIVDEFPGGGKKKQGTIKEHLPPFLLQEVRRIQQYRLDNIAQSDLTFLSSMNDALTNFVQEIKKPTIRGGIISGAPLLLPASRVVDGVIRVRFYAGDALPIEQLREEARVTLKGLHDRGSVFWLEQYCSRNSKEDTNRATLRSAAVEKGKTEEKGVGGRTDGVCHVLAPTRKISPSSCVETHTSNGPLSSGSNSMYCRRPFEDAAEVKGLTDDCWKGMLVLQPEAVMDFVYTIFSFSHMLCTPRSLRCLIQPPPYNITKAEEEDQLTLRKGYLRFPLAVELCSSKWRDLTGANPTNTDILMYLSLLVKLGLGYPVQEDFLGETAVPSEKPAFPIIRSGAPNIPLLRSTLPSTSFFSRAQDLNARQDEYETTRGMDGRRGGTSTGTRTRGQRVPIGIFLPSLSPETCPDSLRCASPLLFSTGIRQRYMFDFLPPALWHRWQCDLHPLLHFLSTPHSGEPTTREESEDLILFPNKPPEATDHHNRWVDACWLRLMAPTHCSSGIDPSPTPTHSTERMARRTVEEEKEVNEVRGFLYYEGTYPCEVSLWVSEPDTSLLTRRLIQDVEGALASLLKEFPGVHKKNCDSAYKQRRGEGTGRVGKLKSSYGVGGGGTESHGSVQDRPQNGKESSTLHSSPPNGTVPSSPTSLSSSVSSFVPTSPTGGVGEDHLEQTPPPTPQGGGSSLPVPRKVSENTNRPVKYGKEVEMAIKNLLAKIRTKEQRQCVSDVLDLGYRENAQEKHVGFSVRNAMNERREENTTKGVAVSGAPDGSSSPTFYETNTLRKVDALDMLVRNTLR